MLKIENVSKYYEYGKNKKMILKDININFKDKGMVFILGMSGSGKSTLLNIIAGNLKSDEGRVLYEGKDIFQYNDSWLDSYRNQVVGYIYQDYNLIEYMNVYDNVRIGLSNNDKEYVDTLLKQLGIYDKRNITVDKLSGGEKQRVAIARSLVNDPRILLCDEPTGALDEDNGIMVMDILKKISKNRLVIVVSHDKDLANRYSDRIINIHDGKIDDKEGMDNDNSLEVIDKSKFIKKKISTRIIRKLAFLHVRENKGRTIMTVLALSLGIISMLLVLSLSSNFNKELNELEKNIVGVFPVTINNYEYMEDNDWDKGYDDDKIYIKNNDKYKNEITDEYVSYIEGLGIDKTINYNYGDRLYFISDGKKFIDNSYIKMIPSREYIDNNYKVIAGSGIVNEWNEVLLKIDSNNMISSQLGEYLGIYDKSEGNGIGIDYDSIIGKKIRVVDNNNLYTKNGSYYYINSDIDKMYNDSYIEVEIVGIIQEDDDNIGGDYIYYDKELYDKIRNINRSSDIVISQVNSNNNVLGIEGDKDATLSYVGGGNTPVRIEIYVDSLYDKKELIEALDKFNKNHDKIIYEDMMASSIEIVRNFIGIISIVLIIFSVVAIVVSLIMIGIITSIRVLERKKEIGILRGIGISKRNIRGIFNYENGLISLMSSLIGILCLMGLVEPVNRIVYTTTKLENMLVVDYKIILLVVIINMIIVRLAGSIPSRRASKLDITKCIYNR